jgi:hypothetical protein
MRIKYFVRLIQLLTLLIFLFCPIVFFSCKRSTDELPVMPPATHPLAREYIGFGVVNVSFAHVLCEPGSAGVSQGYLRRSTVVRIIERRQIVNRGRTELWILAEGNYQGTGTVSHGWLEEATLEIYDSERRANTASRRMGQ